MTVDDPHDRVGEVGIGVDVVQLAGLDQRGDDRPAFRAAVGAGKERILAREGERPDRSLDRVGVDFDPPVVEEADETVPVREPVADRLGELALAAQERKLFAQPWLELGDNRARPFLAGGASFVRLAAADVGLDPIERGDALQGLVGDRRAFGDGALVETAPQVRPAEGERDIALARERPISGVAVDLKDALEAGEMRDRLRRRAVGRVDIGDRRRVGTAPGLIVPRIGPELAGLGPPTPRIEHRRRRLVGEQLRRGLEVRQDALVDRPQMERGAPDPVGERRAVETKALALVDLRLAIERQMVSVFGDEHVATMASVGRPPSISRAGADDWTTTLSQARQAYLGRCTTSTRNCAGTTSSRSLTSSPIRCSAPLQHGQVLSSTSTRVSTRGRCAGKDPRLARRLRAPSGRTDDDFAWGLGRSLRLVLL